VTREVLAKVSVLKSSSFSGSDLSSSIWLGDGMVKSVEKKKSIAGQFEVKYKDDTFCWTKKLSKEDYGPLG